MFFALFFLVSKQLKWLFEFSAFLEVAGKGIESLRCGTQPWCPLVLHTLSAADLESPHHFGDELSTAHTWFFAN